MSTSQNQNQEEIPFLPESREYKLIRAIPRNDSIKYYLFKDYIEIEHILFQNSPTKSKEDLLNEIISFYEQNQDNQNKLLCFLIELLTYYIFIRPKSREIPCFLLSKLHSKYKDKQKYIQDVFEMNGHDSFYFSDFKGFQEFKETDLFHTTYLQSDFFNKKRDFLVSLIEDNLDYLKNYINSDNDLLYDTQFEYLYPVSFTYRKQLKLLDFCCLYGSVNCFKFLKLNGFEYGECITQCSISGGNIEIIHEIEQSGISFDYCFKYSIKYHQKTINEWLLSNYKCEIFSLAKCIKYYDYEAFLYLLLNHVDVNEGKTTPLYSLFQQKELDFGIINFLLELGADVNKGRRIGNKEIYHTSLGDFLIQEKLDIGIINFLLEHGANINQMCLTHNGIIYTPLGYILDAYKIDIDRINFLLEHGADINKECKNSTTSYLKNSSYTPLLLLCQQNEVNIDLIKLLIEHGADVNKNSKITYDGYTTYQYYITPLSYLIEEKLNIELIGFLIDHGADINREYENLSNLTPLCYLIQQEKINTELINFLIDHGADVNKEFKDFHGNISTPLFCICQNKNSNIELIQLLIEKGADVNKLCTYDKYTLTPLSCLCYLKHVNTEAIKYLIDHGADINQLCKDEDGKSFTALCCLCNQNIISFSAIQLLVKAGADVNKGDIKPISCLNKEREDHKQIIQYLLDSGAIEHGKLTYFINYMKKVLSLKL